MVSASRYSSVRVLLVEDDAVITRELGLRWQGRRWAVATAATLRAADAILATGDVDLVVLDLGLPDGDGIDWLAKLREHDRSLPVLVLTARDRVSDRVLGLRTGADDYLVKPFATEELDARLEVLMRRARLIRGEAVCFGGLSWFEQEGRVEAAGRELKLSQREFEVLGLLLRSAPRLVSKRILIDALAERNLEVGDSAAEVYVSRLRRKLSGSGVAIRTLRGFGYQLERVEEGRPLD